MLSSVHFYLLIRKVLSGIESHSIFVGFYKTNEGVAIGHTSRFNIYFSCLTFLMRKLACKMQIKMPGDH